jgi:hypothetical protein
MRWRLLLLPAALLSVAGFSSCATKEEVKQLEARVKKYNNEFLTPVIDKANLAICDLDKHVTGLDPALRLCPPAGPPDVPPAPKYPPP